MGPWPPGGGKPPGPPVACPHQMGPGTRVGPRDPAREVRSKASGGAIGRRTAARSPPPPQSSARSPRPKPWTGPPWPDREAQRGFRVPSGADTRPGGRGVSPHRGARVPYAAQGDPDLNSTIVQQYALTALAQGQSAEIGTIEPEKVERHIGGLPRAFPAFSARHAFRPAD